MDIENPSYFSVSGEAIMGNTDSISSASDCSLSRQSTPPKKRGPFRTFLRSVSSNSAELNQELLIMGEPRLSDIAPDLAFKHPASRSNSLKAKSGQYSPLPTSDEVDEVFISEDSARYYNHSNNSSRRHSISTFMGRERSNSITSSTRSFKDDFPQGLIHATSDGDAVVPSSAVLNIDDHSLRHASYPRKRCARCNKGNNLKPFNMDDILIVSLKSSEAANLWVEYFTSYFQQISKQANRKPFKIQYLWVEENTTNGKDSKSNEKYTGVKLQLVVLCPGLLQFIAENPTDCENLGKILLPDRTLALLLGVADSDLTDIHKKILPNYFQWQRKSVGQDQDENFTKEFLGQAMSILSKVWKQQSSLVSQEKAGFSVSPKKIRQGQNSVFILLTYPLQKDDVVKISIEKNNEIFEIKSHKRRNPYTIKISVPDSLTEVTAIVNILVEKNGNIVGSRPIKCESKLRELEQILRLTNNPIEFMCQTLGFSPANKEQLDNWLLHAFQRNLPAHFNLLANHATPFAAAVHAHKHSQEEYPTLLHFAAKFGFEKLALQLLDCPGADIAYDIRNVFDMTPAEIAETNGHTELGNTLKGYMNMNEFTNVYSKLKEMSANTSKFSSIDEESYLTPKSIEEFYKICPAPRPLPLASPVSDCESPTGYMAMNNPKVDEDLKKSKNSFKIKTEHVQQLPSQPLQPQQSPTHFQPPQHQQQQQQSQTKNFEIVEDKVQKELMEIINDFKNNVHSISQVEKLVEEWKNRNDVQKSFQEKQEQLKEMRLRYEKIQQEMKASLKKPTPFDRVKKLFGRSKSKDDEKQDISSPLLATLSPSISIQSQRPVSSLSTSSSGSSGRMSTISASSLGDSGTHSDNEERKNMLCISQSEDELRNELNKAVLELNYDMVPAPKPVKNSMFANRNSPFETIQEKPLTRPNNLPLNEEYYIQFPPSGLPLPGVVDKKTPDQEYMNISSMECERHEYMNFKVALDR